MNNELYKIPENWQNFGDVNPERHGGLFVKWERDMWHIIKTIHFADLPKGVAKGQHMFQHMWLEPMDFWVNGNPSEGFNEWAIDQLEEYGKHKPFSYNPKVIQEESSMTEFMEHILEENGLWLIGSIAYSFANYYGGYDTDFNADYWDYLENYGVKEENF